MGVVCCVEGVVDCVYMGTVGCGSVRVCVCVDKAKEVGQTRLWMVP